MFEDRSAEVRKELAGYVLQEVAGWDGDGGVDAATLPPLVERRQQITLDAEEVSAALSMLQEKGLVLRVADRYVLTPLMRLRAPKEPDGTITMSRQAWIRLSESLGLSATG